MLRLIILLVCGCLICVDTPPVQASSAYRTYAEKLLSNLPKGAKLRPDLEVRLNAHAINARIKAGRPPLKASLLLRTAARAQALEMLLGNFVGHTSKGGFRNKKRFEAFGGFERGDHGENAARDRQSGPVDATKARRLFQQWLDSRGHKRNLMKYEYKYVSTGAIQIGHHLYAIQMFWEK